MNLEIGMYVRTINGKIWVITSQKAISGHRKDIINASYNIIDLIEVGDYVNGQLVKHIAYFEGVEEPIKKLIFADEYHLIPTEVCEQNEIKSIVTKEQFESIEYKVVE